MNAPQPPPLKQPAAKANQIPAWLSGLINLLALPGGGTILAGRREGWVQMGLALVGFVLTCVWATHAIGTWIRTGDFPCALDGYLLTAAVGAMLFLIAWLWALASSISIMRQKPTSPRPATRPNRDTAPTPNRPTH
jgi:hypothetical protein